MALRNVVTLSLALAALVLVAWMHWVTAQSDKMIADRPMHETIYQASND